MCRNFVSVQRASLARVLASRQSTLVPWIMAASFPFDTCCEWRHACQQSSLYCVYFQTQAQHLAPFASFKLALSATARSAPRACLPNFLLERLPDCLVFAPSSALVVLAQLLVEPCQWRPQSFVRPSVRSTHARRAPRRICSDRS